jgi:metal-responsive CopG/Arc/MetJ family transcriptional regulator
MISDFNKTFLLDNEYNCGYTNFMKTAISIPEDVFQSAEALAKRLGMSRSQLYTAAINEYLNRRQDRRITALLNSIYGEEDSFLPSDIIKLQVGSLSREEW